MTAMALVCTEIRDSRILDGIARSGQLVLVALVVTVLAVLVFPLPPVLLDFLLAVNLIGAVTIVMVSISIPDTMKLASFPTLLLICTLFRLGLNISSTRLILSQGQAGKIIYTFGHFVTGSNLLVGIIVFLVLMIIQFIVVAKGSERVAEVAARFHLDGLPGKQMSIDADLRTGLITSEEAARRRGHLIKESRLYGAMDGAMKFVKGDTIAGFVITVINILGGLLAGTVQQGLSLAAAAKRYTILTVGDGLVAQIPSLLICLAAGFLVTRVGDGDTPRSLGGEIGTQILARPAVLMMVAGTSLVMGFIPGFPFGFFFVGALLLGGLGLALWYKSAQAERELDSVEKHRIHLIADEAVPGQATPLLLEMGADMYEKFVRDARWQVCLNHLFPRLKAHLSRELGVPFPQLKIMVNEKMPSDEYHIKIYEIVVESGRLSPEHCLVREVPGRIELTGRDRPDRTVHGTPVLLLELRRQRELRQRGIPVLAPEEVLLGYLARVLKNYACEFVGIQQVRDILTQVEKTHPELVREVVPRLLSVNKLTEIVKRLVAEQVPIKDFRLILETLATIQPEGKSAVDLTELVRMGMKRVLCHLYANENRLSCFGLDPAIEDEIASHIQKTDGACFLTLAPERLKALSQAVLHMYRDHGLKPRDAVILTTSEVRRYVRKIIETDMPDVAVLSYQELEPRVVIDQRDTISV